MHSTACIQPRPNDGDANNILRIHGEKDLIIKCPKKAEVIKGAGHLVAMTHSDECIRILEKII